MGVPLAGYEGEVTSWGADGTGTVEPETLLAAIAPNTGSISVTGDEADSTPLAINRYYTDTLPLRKTWTASINGMLAGYQGGTQLAVATGGSEYVYRVTGYSLTLSRPAIEITAGSTTGQWKEFRPGQYGVQASFTCQYDSAGGVTLPPAFGTTSLSTFTFTYKTGHTIAFAANPRTTNYTNNRTGLQELTFDLTSKGAVTFAGATTPLFAAGALGAPYYDEGGDLTYTGIDLVFAASSGITLSGPAFWTSVGLTAESNSPTSVAIAAQGTGTLAETVS